MHFLTYSRLQRKTLPNLTIFCLVLLQLMKVQDACIRCWDTVGYGQQTRKANFWKELKNEPR